MRAAAANLLTTLLTTASVVICESARAQAGLTRQYNDSSQQSSADAARVSSTDLSALAAVYERAAGTVASQETGPALLILVSFSMPPASLVRLAEQARRVGAVLVLNGLKEDSLTATAQAVRQVFGAAGAPLQIDPRVFKHYGVTAVPAFLLRRASVSQPPCATEQCPADEYAMAVGDVSVGYALEQIAAVRPGWKPLTDTMRLQMEK
ncbi:type-F conjugative transfer system pilin assembly protein TrbC [Massilia sp. YMA4]|uniref:Type-F conjugative transfer system pilin assembly protein TrbC n=1 Tax=[Empedobacter] haloabium TaxID=592317 RepID=A0ABZ1URQ3_9BURK|nr:type-F conjugative transfer system pilin assembly protein TrbC [Massilia sp. YMA4]AXA94656.1 type-F conjugative transfer system pilin assembly protein TrbC [Massilia sp. YMA4]